MLRLQGSRITCLSDNADPCNANDLGNERRDSSIIGKGLLKALYIIVNAGFSSEVVEIARSVGSTGATIINARGSVAKPKTILGITIDTEKEIVLSVVEKDVAIKIMEKVKETAGVGTPAHGLCFFMPVEMSTLTIHDRKLDEE